MSDVPNSPKQATPVAGTTHVAGTPAATTPAATTPAATTVFQPHIVVEQSGHTLLKIFAWLGWMGVLLCVPIILGMYLSYREYFNAADGIQEHYFSHSRFADDKVAIIHVSGTIMDGQGYVKDQIDRVREDKDVKAIVLRVNSPGGTVSGSDYIYHHLLKLRDERKLPMVVSMGGLAASGGYYVAMAVGDQDRSIYAEPTTTTGSIGVIFPHYDVSGLLENYGVTNDSIVSHPRKQLASMTRTMSEEDREIFQGYVDESFSRFKDIVRAGRPQLADDEALAKLATGEIFTAQQAKNNGLVDEIGFIEEAIDRLLELASLDSDSVRVVEYERPVSLLDVMGASAHAADPSLESALVNLSTPRAYYLWTTMPCLAKSH